MCLFILLPQSIYSLGEEKYTLLTVQWKSTQALGQTITSFESLTDTISHSYTQPVTINWPVNQLVTVNILHISFKLTSCCTGENKQLVNLPAVDLYMEKLCLYVLYNDAFKINDQMDVYESSHCCWILNITQITYIFYQVKCWLLLFWRKFTTGCFGAPLTSIIGRKNAIDYGSQ